MPSSPRFSKDAAIKRSLVRQGGGGSPSTPAEKRAVDNALKDLAAMGGAGGKTAKRRYGNDARGRDKLAPMSKTESSKVVREIVVGPPSLKRK